MTGGVPLRVTFCVLNLRMGGQVSNLIGLAALLEERGVQVRFALPEGLSAPTKEVLDGFARRPLLARLRLVWGMLRGLPREPGHLVHLVLPTPAFALVCLFLPTPRSRVLVQSEGLPTAFDRAHWRDLLDAPAFMLPRLVLNNQWLVRCSRRLGVAQLVTARGYADWLRASGFEDVTCVPNLAWFTAEDGAGAGPAALQPFTGRDVVVGFVGHAHRVKGVDDLLDAFELAQPRRPELGLILALSADGDAGRIRNRIRSMPPAIRARIVVAGLVPVNQLLSTLDALALPYRSLASTTLYPSLLLEAGLARCPVILSDLPGLRDILDRACPGLDLVPPRSPEALARALVDLPRREARAPSPDLLILPSPQERIDLLLRTYQRLLQPPT